MPIVFDRHAFLGHLRNGIVGLVTSVPAGHQNARYQSGHNDAHHAFEIERITNVSQPLGRMTRSVEKRVQGFIKWVKLLQLSTFFKHRVQFIECVT